MGIVHEFEKQKFNLLMVGKGFRQNPSCCGISKDGNKIFDRLKGVVDLATKNKDLITSVGVCWISCKRYKQNFRSGTKAAQRFNELKEL